MFEPVRFCQQRKNLKVSDTLKRVSNKSKISKTNEEVATKRNEFAQVVQTLYTNGTSVAQQLHKRYTRLVNKYTKIHINGTQMAQACYKHDTKLVGILIFHTSIFP